MNLYNHNIRDFSHTASLDSEKNEIYLVEKKIILNDAYQETYNFCNNQGRTIVLYKNIDSFVLNIENVLSFECFIKTHEVFYQLHQDGNKNLLEYWFSHTLLPIFFTISNKYYFLHAGSVRVANTTVLFMADSMGGKSTMTDYFLQQGHKLVSDDKVGTYLDDGRIMLVSSYPYHRPYRKFEDLGIKVVNFESNVTHLDIIYALDVNPMYDEVIIEELKGVEKVSFLIRGTDIGLPLFLKERFAYVTKLANITPVYKIHIPKDITRLHEAYTAITKQMKIMGDKNEFRK